jgi:hypothetical protein
MKAGKYGFLIIGECLFAVGFVASVGRADYTSSDYRLPSPQYRSTNSVIYNTAQGPFVIDSFFDVFVDIDRVPPPPPGTVIVDSFSDIFTELTIHPPSGPPQNVNPVPPNPTIRLAGRVGGPIFVVETDDILTMSLSGGSMPGGVMIRESPTLPSTGLTTIQDLGGGLYHINSFFDVFTELSLDGGQSWIPGSEALHLEGGLPEPSSAVLALPTLAVLGCTGRRQRVLSIK